MSLSIYLSIYAYLVCVIGYVLVYLIVSVHETIHYLSSGLRNLRVSVKDECFQLFLIASDKYSVRNKFYYYHETT